MENRSKGIIIILSVLLVITGVAAVYFGITSVNSKVQLESQIGDLENKVNNFEIKESVEQSEVNDSTEIEENDVDVNKVEMTEEEALNIANDVYKKAYAVFETKGMELSNYFTKKAISKYENWKTLHSDSLYMTTIFSSTGKKIRPLSVEMYNDEKIVVTGQITNVDGETTVKADQYPYYLVLIKENGKWLIDCFE